MTSKNRRDRGKSWIRVFPDKPITNTSLLEDKNWVKVKAGVARVGS